jgi:hypothetical protein
LGWSERKWKQNYFKMAAKLKEKRTFITMVPSIIRSFATFPTHIHYHYPLPLIAQAGMEAILKKQFLLTGLLEHLLLHTFSGNVEYNDVK